MRSRRRCCWMLAAVAALVLSLACAGGTSESASPPGATGAPGTRQIKVGYAGEADFIDLPSLIAHDRLRARGYTIETTFFSASDVAIEAVANGSVDVVHGSMSAAWLAISRGAAIKTVMDHVGDPYRLVTVPEISTCAQLIGRRLALQGGSGVSALLVRAFIEEECKEAKPEELLITESSNRVAALMAGGVDATALELNGLLFLEKQAPGRFKVLSDFSRRWPDIKTTGVHASTAFAKAHPEALRAYLDAILTAAADVEADPSLLVSAANTHMGRADDWDEAARAYLEAKLWPERGGFTRDDVEKTLAFFKRYSSLDPRLSVDAVSDLTHLEAALAGSP